VLIPINHDLIVKMHIRVKKTVIKTSNILLFLNLSGIYSHLKMSYKTNHFNENKPIPLGPSEDLPTNQKEFHKTVYDSFGKSVNDFYLFKKFPGESFQLLHAVFLIF